MNVTLAIFNALSPLLPTTGFFGIRRTLLRCGGITVGRNVRVASGARLYDRYIEIGDEAWVGFDVTIHSTDKGHIRIGARVAIADRVCIISGTHEMGGAACRAGPGAGADIVVGAGTWIGAHSTLIAGASVGSGSVVAAGSVVKAGEYPSDALLAGVPAEVKRLLHPD